MLYIQANYSYAIWVNEQYRIADWQLVSARQTTLYPATHIRFASVYRSWKDIRVFGEDSASLQKLREQ